MRYRGIELRYTCDAARLAPELQRAFVALDADESTQAWIDRALAEPQSRATTALRDLAAKMVSLYDANGLVGAYSMRVLGEGQWRALLGAAGVDTAGEGRLLDVGSGDGEVTAELAALFSEVVTTELSAPMARRLRGRGYTCHEVDVATEPLPDEGTYDVVGLLNVIDRTTHPLRLLERCRELLAPAGRLLVAVPLPLRQAVYVGPTALDPEELLPTGGGDFETDLGALWARTFTPLGFRVQAVSRVPYLCRGDVRSPVQVLDDAVVVLGKE